MHSQTSSNMSKHGVNRKKSLEDQLYVFGLVFLCIFIVGIVLYNIVQPDIAQVKTCVLNNATGYYCPGCGGTRALIRFVRGDIIGSFLYHPVVPYAGILYGIFMVSHTIEKAERLYYRGRRKVGGRYFIRGLKFREWYLYGALAIIIINVIVRNLVIFLAK